MAVKLTRNKGLLKLMRQVDGKVLRIGLFDTENATKAFNLEFGDRQNNQVPRPIFTQTIMEKGTRNILEKALEEVITEEINLQQTADKIADKQRFAIRDQEFNVQPLADTTVRIKDDKGALSPKSVGVDTSEMVGTIEGRIGKRKRRK